MSIYRARLRSTSNALSPQVSSEQIRKHKHTHMPAESDHKVDGQFQL